MKRVWFKKEMKQAILDGKKTSTTRDHQIHYGPIVVEAVSGSRFKAEPFAILRIISCVACPIDEVVHEHFKEEGFESPEDMQRFMKKNRLDLEGEVWFHKFEVVQRQSI